jgi:hypothetical protein
MYMATVNDQLKASLKVGQYGYSLEAISNGKRGEVYVNGDRVVLKAGADIRKWAEVIIITIVPEPTVIETWGVFPLSYELDAGGYQTVGQSTPLPVTMSKAVTFPASKLCTASGNTELIAAPASGQKIRVHYISYSNKQTSAAEVAVRCGASGDIVHRHLLAAQGGNITINLTDANLECDNAEALYAYLYADYSTGVIVTVGYSLEDV